MGGSLISKLLSDLILMGELIKNIHLKWLYKSSFPFSTEILPVWLWNNIDYSKQILMI